MIKVFLIVIAYTLPTGEMKMNVRSDQKACPTVAQSTREMSELKAAGYIKDWAVWCSPFYMMTEPGKPS